MVQKDIIFLIDLVYSFLEYIDAIYIFKRHKIKCVSNLFIKCSILYMPIKKVLKIIRSKYYQSDDL